MSQVVQNADRSYRFQKIATGSALQSGAWYKQKLSAFDQMYFIAGDNNPKVTVALNGSVNVQINGSLVIFLHDDVFHPLAVTAGDSVFKPVTPGVFLVNGIDDSHTKCYSYSTVLHASVLDGKKTVTSFPIYPTLFWQHDGANNATLSGVTDLTTISSIDTLQTIDTHNLALVRRVLSDQNTADFQAHRKFLSLV